MYVNSHVYSIFNEDTTHDIYIYNDLDNL
jgi:hypothetical protein